MSIIDKLIDKYGSAYKAAQALSVSPQLFHIWQKQGYIPFRRGADVEKATSGFIKATEIYIEAAKGGIK